MFEAIDRHSRAREAFSAMPNNVENDDPDRHDDAYDELRGAHENLAETPVGSLAGAAAMVRFVMHETCYHAGLVGYDGLSPIEQERHDMLGQVVAFLEGGRA